MAKKNKKISLQTLEDAKLSSKIGSRFAKSESFFSPYLADNDRWYKMFRNISTKPTNEYRSRVSIPVGFWTIETTVPRMVSQPHKYTMTARDTDNDQAVSHSIQAKQYYDYLLDQVKSKYRTRIMAKDMKIFGNGFWKYGWDVAAGKPFISNIALRNLRIDPSVNEPGNIQRCRYIIHPTRKTKDEIIEDYPEGAEGIDWDSLGKGTKEDYETTQSRDKRLAARGLQTDIKDPVEEEYSVWEHFGWLDGKRRITAVLEKKIILKDDDWKYDFWPFALAVNTEDPDNILGIGDIEPVANLIEEINSNRRLRTDNKNIRTNVMFERLRNAAIRDDEMVWRPGGVINSNVKGGLTPIAIPDTTQGSIEQELLDYQIIEKATNTPPQVQGQLRASGPEAGGLLNRTATAYAGSQRETNTRFKYQSESLDRAVEETLTNLWKMVQEHTDTDQVVRVIGEDDSRKFIEIPAEVIKGEYIIDIKFGSAALEDEAQKRDEALVKLQTLTSTFPASAEIFIKDFLIAMGDKNVDEIAQIIAQQKKAAEEQENLPKPPQVNLSIGGEDVNPIITNEILANYFPLSKMATTPELHEKTRTLMFGQRPEDLERDKLKIQVLEIMLKAKADGVKLDTEQMKVVGDIFSKSQTNESSKQGGQEDTPSTVQKPGVERVEEGETEKA